MSRRTKGSTFARGYGPAHQALRKRWTPQVEAGLVDCAGCGLRIDPGDFGFLTMPMIGVTTWGLRTKVQPGDQHPDKGRRVSVDLGQGRRASRIW